MKLSPRLKAIADMVPKNSIVADIGTDHGYIPVYLIKTGRCKKIIASDINQGPLENAYKTIKNNSMNDNISTRLGNGLDTLKPFEADCVIIAGMGGMLICEILNVNPSLTNSMKYFVLQPMNAQDELRKWLTSNGFTIEDERLAKEGNKLYEILLVKKGRMMISDDIYYEIGPRLIEKKDPLMKEFIKSKIRKYSNIYEMVKDENTEKAQSKRIETNNKINQLQEVLKCL